MPNMKEQEYKGEKWEYLRNGIVSLVHALADSEYSRGFEEQLGAIRRDGGRLMAQEIACRRIIIDVDNYVSSLLSSHTQEVLEAYNDFLLKNNYTDADIYAEKPTAIERFLALKENE